MKREGTEKKGMSSAIWALLLFIGGIIVLSVLWGLLPSIGENLSRSCINIKLTIDTKQGYTCYNPQKNETGFLITRGSDDIDLAGIKVIVTNAKGREFYEINNGRNLNIRMFDIPFNNSLGIPESGGSRLYLLYSEIKPSRIDIAPIINSSGFQKFCVTQSSLYDLMDCS